MLSGVVERLLKALQKTRPPTVRQFFGLANQHMRWELNDLARSNPAEAEALFRRIQAAHPSDYWANMALGNALLERRDTDGIGYYRAAVALRPEGAEAHCCLGTALGEIGRIPEAIESLRRAAALDPTSSESEYNLALCFLRSRQSKEALEHARIATRLNPKHTQAHLVTGDALKNLGDYPGAIESYQRAIDLEPAGAPRRAKTERLIAKCKEEEAAAAGRSPEAIDSLQRTAAKDPANARSHLYLGLALGTAGRRREAIDALTQSVALDSTDACSQYNLAFHLLNAGRFEEALEHARASARIDSTDSPTHFVAGHALQKLGKYTEALESFQRALALEPKGKPRRALIERAYTECKEAEAAAAIGPPTSPAPRGP